MGVNMILMAFAAAALMQWTGPRTEEYRGPGNFCGGGYRVHLARGDRALILPQDTGGQGTRLVLAGREVNIRSGERPRPGPVVRRYRGSDVTQQSQGAGIGYSVGDDTPFGLSISSTAFRGFKSDRWFFNQANFDADADSGGPCLAAFSH
jgi:hypothetical protein